MATRTIKSWVDSVDGPEEKIATYEFSNGRTFVNHAIPTDSDWSGTAIADGEGFVISDGEYIITDGT